MRTTITLDEDVAAALNRLRRERSIRLSQAVNELIRAGLRVRREQRSFRQRTQPIGLRIDVTNVADALEELEGPAHR
ncbi:MAG: CopG family transcriptional regulator [Chloroflexi bacterium]|nr:CopG family transcriptional regulator [Chloroflexota bacterium]